MHTVQARQYTRCNSFPRRRPIQEDSMYALYVLEYAPRLDRSGDSNGKLVSMRGVETGWRG